MANIQILLNIYLMFSFLLLCSCDTDIENVSEAPTTEPVEELSFGCPPPSIRFSRVRKPEPTQAPIHVHHDTTHSSEDSASENFDSPGHQNTQADDGKQGDSTNRKMRYTDEPYLWDDEIKNLRLNNKRDRRTAITRETVIEANKKGDTGQDDVLIREKRKSGKTTGALSRQSKTDSGSSKSATSNRKVQSGNIDEESGVPPLPDQESASSESREEDDDSSEETNFREVNEIEFPGEVGSMGERKLCKIKCIKGKWVGPLCATGEEGNMNFQPLYKNCYLDRISTNLLLSYKNVSVTIGWVLPHGQALQARCSEIGMYKLLGESRVHCSNGLWAPRMPSCVPTTLLTNYSDDSPPSVNIKIGTGSGAVEPSGVLAVLPGSTIYLDCMYPRRRGIPEWTWTGWSRQYLTGWSTIPEEKAHKFRLTIKDVQNQDSGTFTCASPRGLTNSIVIIVTVSQCQQISDNQTPLTLHLEGTKLGQKAIFSCPLGYELKGNANSTCLASGNWSSPPPLCHPIQCPSLVFDDPHLSLVELNASAWGRAVFSCSWGYKLNGPPGVECEPSGSWSGPVPRCRAIQCPQPIIPINSKIDAASSVSTTTGPGPRRYAVGALVTFSCTEGNFLEGEASIVCTETGFWSHPPPFCKSQCAYPGDPPNGLIAPLKFHYDPGDALSVQCRPGFIEYSLHGATIQRPICMTDGNWSDPVPQCKNYEEV